MSTLRWNGREIEVAAPSTAPLLDVLRDELGDLTPKPGCREGSCGACAVLLDGEPAISCLLPVGRVAGHEITTLEGLTAPRRDRSMPSSRRSSAAAPCSAASARRACCCRCGRCSTRTATGPRQVQRELANNLCRCTGYSKILEAAGQVLRREATSRA